MLHRLKCTIRQNIHECGVLVYLSGLQGSSEARESPEFQVTRSQHNPGHAIGLDPMHGL